MDFEQIDREQDISILRAETRRIAVHLDAIQRENLVLLREIARLTAELAKATQQPEQQALNFEIRKLNEELAKKNQELFGSSRSERRSTHPEPGPSPKPRHPGHGPTPQPRLPFIIENHVLDEADRICPCCGKPLLPMTDQTEDSEQIAFTERKVARVLHRRQKYHCGACSHVETALGPAPLVPGGRYSPEFAIAVAIDKYKDHLPLDRQVHRFDRLGFQVTTQTLWDQLVALYFLLLASYLALHDDLLTEPVLGADESHWRRLDLGPVGRSARWWIWALTGKGGVFYMLQSTRGSAGAIALLKNFAGILMADGYAVYASLENAGRAVPLFDELVRQQPVARFVLAACWMHARRGFFEVQKNYPAAGRILDLIGQLYAIEDRAVTEAQGDPARLLEVRRTLRDTESRPVIGLIDAWRKVQTPTPGLGPEKALNYLHGQWPRLILFLEDPKIPLDNGQTERAMRGPVLGRKNHYGSRSELGTRVAALFYSLIESCTQLGVDPSAYLAEAVRRARAIQGSALLPRVFAAELAAKRAATSAPSG